MSVSVDIFSIQQKLAIALSRLEMVHVKGYDEMCAMTTAMHHIANAKAELANALDAAQQTVSETENSSNIENE